VLSAVDTTDEQIRMLLEYIKRCNHAEDLIVPPHWYKKTIAGNH
jgi:hypothetical protein